MNLISRVLTRGVSNARFFSSNAFGHDSLKRFNLSKKLLTTLLFGGTFLAALWSKKRRGKTPEAFLESQLLSSNDKYAKSFAMYKYRDFTLPKFVLQSFGNLKEFKCREDDIYVVSFPKTGTTWLQEIVYCVMNDGEFSLENLENRFPYLEFFYPGVASIEKMSGQRFIKTHLPYSLLPKDIHEKKPKIFYMMRNPKDVTVSYYHFVRMLKMSNYSGSFSDFAKEMIQDEVPYGPLWKHYSEIWTMRNEPNILILFYEDFHKDIRGSIRKISDFLGKNLTDEEIDRIAIHCNFLNMASNPTVNYSYWDDLGMRNKNEAKFFRKGIIGDWKNYFTSDLNKEMDQWIHTHLEGRSLDFTYELSENRKRTDKH